jgi:hypothetical protein
VDEEVTARGGDSEAAAENEEALRRLEIGQQTGRVGKRGSGGRRGGGRVAADSEVATQEWRARWWRTRGQRG